VIFYTQQFLICLFITTFHLSGQEVLGTSLGLFPTLWIWVWVNSGEVGTGKVLPGFEISNLFFSSVSSSWPPETSSSPHDLDYFMAFGWLLSFTSS
jgi:hypothetical protein